MMTVLSVKNVKGHLVAVSFDDGKTVYIERDYAAETGIKAGFSTDDITEILKESDYRRAKSRALWFLDRGDRTEKTLCEKITQGGISREAALKAIARLSELGLVDDRRFAENYYARLKEQNVSKRASYLKLYQKGVPADIIKEVLSADTETDEVSQVLCLIEKKYKSKISAENGAQKTAAALLRKGFSYSSVREAMKRFNTEMDLEEI